MGITQLAPMMRLFFAWMDDVKVILPEWACNIRPPLRRWPFRAKIIRHAAAEMLALAPSKVGE